MPTCSCNRSSSCNSCIQPRTTISRGCGCNSNPNGGCCENTCTQAYNNCMKNCQCNNQTNPNNNSTEVTCNCNCN